jgi:hypothetical protein
MTNCEVCSKPAAGARELTSGRPALLASLCAEHMAVADSEDHEPKADLWQIVQNPRNQEVRGPH